MKLKEYAAKLTELAQKYPNAKVIIELNAGEFDDIKEPSLGEYNEGVFYTSDSHHKVEVNSICLN